MADIVRPAEPQPHHPSGPSAPFITLNMSCHSLLTCRVSVDKSADSLTAILLYVICLFTLLAFNILSLSFIFVSLIAMSRYVPPLVYPAWDSLWLLNLVDYFLFHVQGVFSYYLFKYFLRSFLSSSEVKLLSRVRLFASAWTLAHQAPQSIEFSRQEYWSRSPFSSPGDLHILGIKPRSPALQANALPSELQGKPWWNIKDGTNESIYKIKRESQT